MRQVIGIALLSMITASAAGAMDPRVVLETSKGRIVVELYSGKMLKTVENFLGYVESGFYDGTLFHLVTPGSTIHAGAYTAEFEQKATRPPIPSEADKGSSNKRGTLALDRTNGPHSGAAQFFINVVDNTHLDHTSKTPGGWGYTAFATVIEGMEVVDAIAAVPTTRKAPMRNVPVEPVTIDKASVVAAAKDSSVPPAVEGETAADVLHCWPRDNEGRKRDCVQMEGFTLADAKGNCSDAPIVNGPCSKQDLIAICDMKVVRMAGKVLEYYLYRGLDGIEEFCGSLFLAELTWVGAPIEPSEAPAVGDVRTAAPASSGRLWIGHASAGVWESGAAGAPYRAANGAVDKLFARDLELRFYILTPADDPHPSTPGEIRSFKELERHIPAGRLVKAEVVTVADAAIVARLEPPEEARVDAAQVADCMVDIESQLSFLDGAPEDLDSGLQAVSGGSLSIHVSSPEHRLTCRVID